MADLDRTSTATESDILDVVEASLEVALEDAETVAEALDFPAIADATFERTERKGEVRVNFANGEAWLVTITARVIR